nr:hypothetical protein [Tanacetum cinerariifolium]
VFHFIVAGYGRVSVPSGHHQGVSGAVTLSPAGFRSAAVGRRHLLTTPSAATTHLHPPLSPRYALHHHLHQPPPPTPTPTPQPQPHRATTVVSISRHRSTIIIHTTTSTVAPPPPSSSCHCHRHLHLLTLVTSSLPPPHRHRGIAITATRMRLVSQTPKRVRWFYKAPGVLANGVDLVLEKEFALFALQEPCYNQNFSDTYYPHNSPSFLCCANCGGPHESFQCQPMNQNDFYSGFDQPPQYIINHQPLIIQEDLNQKLISDEFMTELRNELFIALQSMVAMSSQREQTANLSTHTFKPSRRFNSICYDDDDDDDDEERSIPLCDIISQLPLSIVITLLLLSYQLRISRTLSQWGMELSTVPEKEPDEFINECDLSSCENNSMSGNPTPFSDSEVESLSLAPIPYEDSDHLLKETDILLSYFDNSSPENETFSFDIEEKNSGSTTTHSDYSLPDNEVFYFDDNHIEEK